MSTQAGALPEALRSQRQLGADERFTFACHPGLRCFTRCCADINILLTPLDVLRLARRRGMTTREFLDTHTLTPITKELHLPVVMLRMGADPERRCPFVHPETGCTVYDERPWACRMYPLGMALPPARAGVEPQPLYVMFEEDFCLGRGEKREWTVNRWRNDQGIVAHDEIEAGFREIVSHPWFIGGRQLDPKRMEMYFTGCYDLDTFRSFIFESTFLRRFELDEALVEKLRTDDMELFRFAFRWLRYALFGEPTMKVRPDAPSSRRNK
ncbi:MAG: YkgJ family cysteine cluster protein [Acidobacteriota bacterium]